MWELVFSTHTILSYISCYSFVYCRVHFSASAEIVYCVVMIRVDFSKQLSDTTTSPSRCPLSRGRYVLRQRRHCICTYWQEAHFPAFILSSVAWSVFLGRVDSLAEYIELHFFFIGGGSSSAEQCILRPHKGYRVEHLCSTFDFLV